MEKDQIAETLAVIGQLLELKGENAFKIRAYTQAVRVLETTPLSPEELSDQEHLESLPGIGKALAEKIATLATGKPFPFLEKLKADFPPGIFALFELQGLGAKKIKALHEQLKIDSIAALEAACKDGSVASLPGFGETSAKNFLKAIEQKKQGEGRFRYGSIAAMAEHLLEDIRSLPQVNLCQIAGSFRRRKEIVGDLDFIVSSKEPEAVSRFFVSHPLVRDVLAHGATKSSVILQSGIQCDLRVVQAGEYPFALNYFTGSKEHNVRIRGRALERGWSLNEYRFSAAAGKELTEPLPEIREEADLYRALKLDYIPPELREDLGEVAAAESGSLPRLIELTHIRGAVHNHTIESDGKNTLEEMARAAEDLGLEYLGIADHSKASFQANGLDESRLAKQVEAIRALNASGRFQLKILAGTECDILKDGSLDFSDSILSSLDYVVASVHSSFTMDAKAMTKRIIRAIENPHVNLLAHPTGRLLLQRESYALDLKAILEAAAATGTAIELNANPYRLDLDWRWWPTARELGVRCIISADAHTTVGLKDLYFGVGIARKGWLTRADVLNCLPVDKFLQALGRNG